MSATTRGKGAPGGRQGVTVHMPEARLPAHAGQIPQHAEPSYSRPGEATGASKATRLAPFLVVLLALVLAYVLFTVGTMVPQARAHFLHLVLNPAPAHFLKAD